MTPEQNQGKQVASAGLSSGHMPGRHHGFTNAIVHVFLHSNLSLILTIIAAAMGLAALLVTPREEDPQIIVPLADVIVNCPGHSAHEVEQLVATPLEKILYQIDGVEYVYSMSQENVAIITVRYYVGEDRERSLVKLYKKMDENVDLVPNVLAGVETVDPSVTVLGKTTRLPLILSTALLQRLGYLAMAIMPFVLSRGRVEALILLQALVTLPTAVVNTAVTTLIPDLTSPQRRGQVVSVRWLLLAVTATVAALAGGAFLDLFPVPLNYQLRNPERIARVLENTWELYKELPDDLRPRRSRTPQPPDDRRQGDVVRCQVDQDGDLVARI